MKIQLSLFTNALLLMLLTSWQQGTSQTPIYHMDDVANPFVMIELKAVSSKKDSLESAKDNKAAVEQIKAINTKLGYEPFDKKIASFALTAKGKSTTYLAVRNFKDFTEAEAYSYNLWKEIPKEMCGEIGEPFPISQANYKTCVAEKDFNAYYKIYNSSRK